MKRLLLVAAFAVALSLPLAKPAAAACYQENYGYQCATTCVYYNDQGSVREWITVLRDC